VLIGSLQYLKEHSTCPYDSEAIYYCIFNRLAKSVFQSCMDTERIERIGEIFLKGQLNNFSDTWMLLSLILHFRVVQDKVYDQGNTCVLPNLNLTMTLFIAIN
jgi:hypothetical protein